MMTRTECLPIVDHKISKGDLVFMRGSWWEYWGSKHKVPVDLMVLTVATPSEVEKMSMNFDSKYFDWITMELDWDKYTKDREK